MRAVNMTISITLLVCLAFAGSCLYGFQSKWSQLESLTCPLLGPSIVVSSIAAVIAVAMFALGVMIYFEDRTRRLIPSLYALNMLLALLVPFGLVL